MRVTVFTYNVYVLVMFDRVGIFALEHLCARSGPHRAVGTKLVTVTCHVVVIICSFRFLTTASYSDGECSAVKEEVEVGTPLILFDCLLGRAVAPRLLWRPRWARPTLAPAPFACRHAARRLRSALWVAVWSCILLHPAPSGAPSACLTCGLMREPPWSNSARDRMASRVIKYHTRKCSTLDHL